MDNKKVRVCKDGNSDYTTINEALKHVNDYDTIYIDSGVYNEKITIDKQIELIGNKNNVPIIQTSKGNVCVVNARAKLSNIHFRNSSEQKPQDIEKNNLKRNIKKKLDSILLINDECKCCNCEISNAVNSNIKIQASGKTISLDHCKIHNACRNGVYISDESKTEITNCKIYHNGNNGITVVTADLFLDSSEICNIDGKVHGVSSGILIDGTNNNNVEISNCNIHDIRGNGIALSGKGNTTTTNCEVFNIIYGEQSAGIGLYITENSESSFKNCNIHHIEGVGIWIQDECSTKVEECEIYNIYDNKNEDLADGIRIYDNNNVTISKCSIHDYDSNSIYIVDDSKPIINECEVEDSD